ncbi:DgyrCDS2046 [Dimorphilus gyrociliatus]|uniref:Putative 2'-deoxynucleoside 5'-phosphate N-hydrolase 1 n=1 Tax=Dimorphilus gyrociliatus TaxID=2664684 RepID=A0A7I8V924_9ANNE|nr:DgyrCDS2046 [Dimorphilus gyrociliatus]
MGSLKLYFAGSIRGGRNDAELYARLIEKLQKYGTVLTEHVGSDSKTEELRKELEYNDEYIHKRDMEWLESCDALIAEVTQPSIGVGYEVGRAYAMKKLILCLYRPHEGAKRISAMISGAVNGENFFVKNYQESEIDGIFEEFLSKIK